MNTNTTEGQALSVHADLKKVWNDLEQTGKDAETEFLNFIKHKKAATQSDGTSATVSASAATPATTAVGAMSTANTGLDSQK